MPAQDLARTSIRARRTCQTVPRATASSSRTGRHTRLGGCRLNTPRYLPAFADPTNRSPPSATAAGVGRAPVRRRAVRAPLGLRRAPLGLRRAPLGLRRAPLGLRRVPLGLRRVPLGLRRALRDAGPSRAAQNDAAQGSQKVQ
jgi:hypothetical protein